MVVISSIPKMMPTRFIPISGAKNSVFSHRLDACQRKWILNSQQIQNKNITSTVSQFIKNAILFQISSMRIIPSLFLVWFLRNPVDLPFIDLDTKYIPFHIFNFSEFAGHLNRILCFIFIFLLSTGHPRAIFLYHIFPHLHSASPFILVLIRWLQFSQHGNQCLSSLKVVHPLSYMVMV